MPLVVALHGCTQTARDFAAGTRFDEIAERYGAIVLYPEQSTRANPRRCWNWFLPEHQEREHGEPAAILALVEAVRQAHPVDDERIFVAGLSAGGAMAAILAEQAPDVFSAVGVMAGIPLHVTHDVPSALEAMAGVSDADIAPVLARAGGARPGYERLRATVWSGAADRLVAPRNASVLARQFVSLLGLDETVATFEHRDDVDIVRWIDGQLRVRVEARSVPGIGHGWSGGSFRGSHTFPKGPAASDAMMEFFMSSS